MQNTPIVYSTSHSRSRSRRGSTDRPPLIRVYDPIVARCKRAVDLEDRSIYITGYIYFYVQMYFLGQWDFFSLPAARLFSCSRLRGIQGARRNTRAQVRALADVRGTCSGALGVQSRTSPRGGIPSTYGHPAPCKPAYRLKECPTAHVISGILNVINVVRHYLLGDGKFSPDTDMPDMRPRLVQ